MNQNGYISYCRFIVKGCNFCFCFFVIFLCKLNFTTRQSILASFLVYLVLAQDSGFFLGGGLIQVIFQSLYRLK